MEDNFLKVIEWEYKSLKTEVEDCYKHAFQLYSWGLSLLLAAIGLVMKGYLPSELLFVIMVASGTLEMIWLGQMVRINRAGRYLRFIEAKVNAYLDNTEPDWQPVCRKMQKRVPSYEKQLNMSGFGYDFSKPIYWETWLSSNRDKGYTIGHLSWLYYIEAGVFPGVCFLCPLVYFIMKKVPVYWYFILLGLILIVVFSLFKTVAVKFGLRAAPPSESTEV